MTGPDIKICGLSTPDALDAAIAARASHAGFVFYPPSPRHIALDAAKSLGAKAAGRIAKVGLFVDADDKTLTQAIAAAGLGILQ